MNSNANTSDILGKVNKSNKSNVRKQHQSAKDWWNIFAIAVVQLVNLAQLFVTLWTAACKASLSSKISLSLLTLMSMSIKSVILSNHLILCCPFSFCLQSFPALGSLISSSPLPRALVPSLVGEQRSHKSCSMDKTKKQNSRESRDYLADRVGEAGSPHEKIN